MKMLVRVLALVAALSLVAAACGDDDDDGGDATTTTAAEAATTTAAADEAATTTAAAEADDEMADDEMADEELVDIVDTAVASGEFPTLVAAVQAADLVETLKGEGPFTVFAPTEEAFEALLADLGITAEELLADTELLTSVLTYHVVPDEVYAADVVTLDGQEVPTVNGATILVTVDGETVMVNDATVVATDVAASNGVIHVIDTVLVPAS